MILFTISKTKILKYKKSKTQQQKIYIKKSDNMDQNNIILQEKHYGKKEYQI